MSSIFDIYDFGDYHSKKTTYENSIGFLIFRTCSKGNQNELLDLLSATSTTSTTSTTNDINEENNLFPLVNGYNALHIACKKGYREIIHILLSKYPYLVSTSIDNIDLDGRNAGMIVVFEKNYTILNILLQYYTKELIESQDKYGNTIFHHVAYSGCIECMNQLYQYILNNQLLSTIHILNNESISCIQYAIAANNVLMVEFLSKLDHQDISSALDYRNIHRAAMSGAKESLEILIQLPQNKDSYKFITSNGSTALHLSCQYGYLDITKILILNYQYDVNHLNDYNLSPLMYACISGHIDIVMFLIQQGANIIERNSLGMRPIHLAASNGHLSIVKLLSTYPEVDLFAKDNHNQTPIEVAIANGYRDIATQIAFISCVHSYSEQLMKSHHNNE